MHALVFRGMGCKSKQQFNKWISISTCPVAAMPDFMGYCETFLWKNSENMWAENLNWQTNSFIHQTQEWSSAPACGAPPDCTDNHWERGLQYHIPTLGWMRKGKSSRRPHDVAPRGDDLTGLLCPTLTNTYPVIQEPKAMLRPLARAPLSPELSKRDASFSHISSSHPAISRTSCANVINTWHRFASACSLCYSFRWRPPIVAMTHLETEKNVIFQFCTSTGQEIYFSSPLGIF